MLCDSEGGSCMNASTLYLGNGVMMVYHAHAGFFAVSEP